MCSVVMTKKVRIRDRYVGAAKIFAVICITIFFLSVEVLQNNIHLKLHPVEGEIHAELASPAIYPVPSKTGYCSQFAGTGGAGVKRPCYMVPSEVEGHQNSNNQVLLTTRYSHRLFNMSCLQGVRTEQGMDECAGSRGGLQFVLGAELYSLRLSNCISNVKGDTENGCSFIFRDAELDLQQAMVVRGSGDEGDEDQAKETRREGNWDVVPISTLMQAVGVDLDQNDGAKGSYRLNGVTVMLDIEYKHNFWGTPNGYVYRVRQLPQEPDESESSHGFSNVDWVEARVFTRAGIRIYIRLSGYTGSVTFERLCLTALSFVGTIVLTDIITQMIMLRLMPLRDLYRMLVYEESIDFSDLNNGHPQAIEAMEALWTRYNFFAANEKKHKEADGRVTRLLKERRGRGRPSGDSSKGESPSPSVQALDSPKSGKCTADSRSLEELFGHGGHDSGRAVIAKQNSSRRSSPRTLAAEGDLGGTAPHSDWAEHDNRHLQQWLNVELELRLAALRKEIIAELGNQFSQDLERRIAAALADRQLQDASVSEVHSIEKVRVVDGVVEGLDQELRSELFNVSDRLQSAVGELRGAINRLEQDMHDEIEQVSAALTPGRSLTPGILSPVIIRHQETPMATPPSSGRKPMPGSQKCGLDSKPWSPRLATASEAEEEPHSCRSRQGHVEVPMTPLTPRSQRSWGTKEALGPGSTRPSLESEVTSVSSGTTSSYNIAGFFQRTRKGWMMRRLAAEQRGHWHLESSVPSGRGDAGRSAPGPSAVPSTKL